MEKHCQERYYLRCGGAGHRIKEYPYLLSQSSRYPNLTPRVSPTPGDPFTGAGLSEPRRRVRQVNNSKVKKKKKKVNITNSDMNSELKSGKKITLTQNHAIGVIKEPEME